MSNNEKKEGDIIFKGKTETIYKVIVIGDPAVGKTELLTKFASDKFEEKYLPTVGVSILKKPIELKDYNTIVNLLFWDIAGQPQFYMLQRPYFNGADGMLLVFDMTRTSTFSNINNWYSAAVKNGLSGIPRILIGNKAHLAGERKIILPMAAHLGEKLNAHYYETSSLSGHNVKEVFEKIAELIYRAKGLGGTGGGGKLIIKPYQGKTIKVPEKIQHRKKKKIDSLVDPMWLWMLDHFKKFPRPSSYIPQIPGSYMFQTNISKKEKKKLAKEKKKQDKEKTKLEKEKKIIEKREKQENLIEDMKKSKKIEKEKQLEPFIPFTGKSKTKVASEFGARDRDDRDRFPYPYKSKYPEIRVEFTVKNFFDAPEIKRCLRCGAIGKDIKTNRPPMIIVNCKLDFPKYTCIKCGYNWGSLL